MRSRRSYRGLGLLLCAACILMPLAAFAETTTYSYSSDGRTIRVESGKLAITATAGTNGTISPSGVVPVSFRGSQTFTITPSTGYHISSLKVNGTAVSSFNPAGDTYTFPSVTSAQTIEAQFAINTYPLTVSLNTAAGGSVTSVPAGINCGANCSATYNHGASITLTANPDIAYNFTGWSGDCAGTGPCTLTMNSAKSATANFAIKTFTITANVSGIGSGTITPPGNTTVNYGGSQTYTIGSPSGYVLNDVVVDGVPVGPVTSYTFSNITAGHTIVATFSSPNLPVRITGATPRYFSALQEAYNAASDGETIQVQAVTLMQNLDANRSVSVILQGGYSSDYMTQTGDTTLNGQIQTFPDSGTLTIDNFILVE